MMMKLSITVASVPFMLCALTVEAGVLVYTDDFTMPPAIRQGSDIDFYGEGFLTRYDSLRLAFRSNDSESWRLIGRSLIASVSPSTSTMSATQSLNGGTQASNRYQFASHSCHPCSPCDWIVVYTCPVIAEEPTPCECEEVCECEEDEEDDVAPLLFWYGAGGGSGLAGTSGLAGGLAGAAPFNLFGGGTSSGALTTAGSAFLPGGSTFLPTGGGSVGPASGTTLIPGDIVLGTSTSPGAGGSTTTGGLVTEPPAVGLGPLPGLGPVDLPGSDSVVDPPLRNGPGTGTNTAPQNGTPNIHAIPEPTSIAIWSLLGILGFRARRRVKS